MRALQVLDEISKKNTSLLTIAQILNSYEFLSKKSVIVTSNNIEKINKIIVLENSYKNLFLDSKIIKILKYYKPEVVHIHGMWRPIQFLFIMHCAILRIPVFIQPHGMLLPQALKSRSIFSYILKLISIYFFYKFFPETKFIAVTNEEKINIQKYFKRSNVYVIKNPFNIPIGEAQKIENKFVYLGRYNKHKNLKEFIQAFMLSKKTNGWIFEIYGIDDDPAYKDELIKLVKEKNYFSKIRFLEPEFNIKKKFKIISSASCNILLSKSEVLSLSVLEAFSKGVPSLVNKELHFPNWIKRNLYLSTLKSSDLIKNINFIINKTQERKIYLKSKLKKIFFEKYKFNSEKLIYKKILKMAINNNNKSNTLFSNISILSANILNIILIPFLILLSVFFNQIPFATEIGIVPGLVLLITQLFSGNSRSLLIYNDKTKILNEVVNLRANLSFIIFILSIVTLKLFYNTANYTIFIFLILIVCFSWINEIFITLHEKNRSIIFIKFFNFFYILFYILIFFSFLQKNFNLFYILLNFTIFQILFFLYHFNLKKQFALNFKKNFYNYSHKILPIVSNFSNIISVIIWRFSLLFLMGKSVAGIYFAAFSIASFPGSLFNGVIAQSVIMNKGFKNIYEKFNKSLSLGISSLIIAVIAIFNTYYNQVSNLNFINIVLISLFGTLIMLKALYIRHQKLSLSFISQKKVFYADIYYSILISPLILFLYYIAGREWVALSYFFSSIIAYFFYKKIKI
jgi:glycosyltransferase involved in cell wall biosynthesis